MAQLAHELSARPHQIVAALALLDGGASVPFIARYRKEATDGLDDTQLRDLESRLAYLRELEARRAAVLASIAEQGKLTPALHADIAAASTKQELEDLYAPFKPKRRSKGSVAREAGLEPLADRLFADPTLVPLEAAEALAAAHPGGWAALAEAGYSDAPAALDGVRDLLAERWAEDAALVGSLREWLWSVGVFASSLASFKTGQTGTLGTGPPTEAAAAAEAARFRDYFDYSEPLVRVPSHRALAVFRGRALDLLDVRLVAPGPVQPMSPAEARIAQHVGWRDAGRAADALLRKCVAWTWKVKLSLSLERDLFARLRAQAEKVAIKVFADNLRDLLLAAPAGKRVVMGLDPGIRTGVKVAVVNATGRVEATATVYPHEPRRDWQGALLTLTQLARAHGVNLVAIGNGTASRETDKLAGELISALQQGSGGSLVTVQKVVVSEAGASVYSASALASQELPDLDVSLRGAVSIARRVQDPLAELVKIDPKSIGVGQYQHDVDQAGLARSLDAVVEDCVNAVGVDLNTASPPLLARVSGLSAGVAAALVRWRDAHGAFVDRQQLLDVAGLGPKTFEQAAGFLRIRGGSNPLDASGVHPEAYSVVDRIAAAIGQPVAGLIGRSDVLRNLRPEAFADARFGIVTVQDLLHELDKPGRDPRPDFKVARLTDGVEQLKDLVPGMLLEGTVSNVAQFGAFVDLGVHQDGLVHVSQLANKFIKDAREVVKTGDIVKVRVIEVDAARKRIALTMKLDAPLPTPDGRAGVAGPGAHAGGAARAAAVRANEPVANSMADAFDRLRQQKRP